MLHCAGHRKGRGAILLIKGQWDLFSLLRALREEGSIRLCLLLLLLEMGLQRWLQAKATMEGHVTPSIEPPAPEASAAGVPALIFQTWKTRSDVPENYRYWSASFLSLNPGYLHVLWGDAENRAFITSEFPWFLPFYDAYPQEIYRADMIRPFFLFRFGGLYSDLDTECIRPIEDMLRRGDMLLGTMGDDQTADDRIPNAMMASAPHQLFWMLVVTLAIEKLRTQQDPVTGALPGPDKLTGPVLLKEAVEIYQRSSAAETRERCEWVLRQLEPGTRLDTGRLVLLPSTAWYPINWMNPLHQIFRRRMLKRRFVPARWLIRLLFPRASLITYWTHSW